MDIAAIYFLIFIAVVLITRVVGAWMLRINEVISELKGIREELRKLNGNSGEDTAI